MLADLKKELQKLKEPQKAKILARFFKTGKGEYGEGDVFLGLTVPQSRQLAKKYKSLTTTEIEKLLKSKVHEERLIAILILVHNFQIAQNTSEVGSDSSEVKRLIFDFYLKNTKYINNWDLVDLSADKIVGGYLVDRGRSELLRLAGSGNLWERRIAIIATYQFIKSKSDFRWTFKIAQMLLSDKHDLIHKAVGWMLREVGKRDQVSEEKFLRKYFKNMPRTTLRYAIEKFDLKKREFYLKKDDSKMIE